MQNGCQRAFKSSLSPRVLRSRVPQKNGLADAEGHFRRTALLMLWRRLPASSHHSDERFPERPVFPAPVGLHNWASHGLACHLRKVDQISNRPSLVSRVATFRVCRSVQLARSPRNSAAHSWAPTTGPCYQAESRLRSSGRAPDLVFLNKSIEKSRCRPDTLVFPYVQSGLR
jgi:hypothetical protein